jgi:hypothetical protein
MPPSRNLTMISFILLIVLRPLGGITWTSCTGRPATPLGTLRKTLAAVGGDPAGQLHDWYLCGMVKLREIGTRLESCTQTQRDYSVYPNTEHQHEATKHDACKHHTRMLGGRRNEAFLPDTLRISSPVENVAWLSMQPVVILLPSGQNSSPTGQN